MNQYAQKNLLSPSFVGFGAAGRSELPFVLGERAFDVDALGVDVARESTLERSTVTAPGPLPCATHVDRSHQGSNSQKLSAEFVMTLTVVGRVRQHLIQGDPQGPFHHGWGEIRGVVGRTLPHLGRQPQVAAGMTKHRQLGEPVGPEASCVGTLAAVVEAHVPGFVPGGIDNSLGLFLDQAASVGEFGDRVEQSIETPFFRRR